MHFLYYVVPIWNKDIYFIKGYLIILVWYVQIFKIYLWMFAFAFPRRLSLWIKMAWIKSVSISLKYKNKVWSIGRVVCSQKQGRIHGYSSRVRVGRSRAGEGHQGIWSGVVCSTRPDTRLPVADGWAGAEMHFSTRGHGPTDGRTDRQTDGQRLL